MNILKYQLYWNHKNDSIIHDNIKFTEFIIKDFIWWPEISFLNCKTSGKHKKIHISQSNLDKTQFHNCDFSLSEMHIENSNLTEIVSTNLLLPENILSNSNNDKREVYRQLKYHFSKQWDSFNALKYYNKEMTALLINAIKKIDLSDIISLWLWKIISWNGTNWLYAFFWIVIINVISCYYFLIFSWITLEINTNIDFNYLLLNMKYTYFLWWINDLKNLFLLNEFSVKSEMLFYVTKVINAVLFYHLIISFRKYNKQF